MVKIFSESTNLSVELAKLIRRPLLEGEKVLLTVGKALELIEVVGVEHVAAVAAAEAVLVELLALEVHELVLDDFVAALAQVVVAFGAEDLVVFPVEKFLLLGDHELAGGAFEAPGMEARLAEFHRVAVDDFPTRGAFFGACRALGRRRRRRRRSC